MTDAAFQQATRQSYGLVFYRGLANLMFLLVSFSTFPTAKWAIGFGLVVFNVAVGSIIHFNKAMALAENKILDLAERKSRHTVLLAQQWALEGRRAEGGEFWTDVEHNVNEELGDTAPGAGVWKSIGLVTWNVLSRLVWDLFVIGVAAARPMTALGPRAN